MPPTWRLKNFRGGIFYSDYRYLLRAKSRNVERSILKIFESKKADIFNNSNTSPDGKTVEDSRQSRDNIQTYLNRLSSLFFALARWEARGKKEQNPKYR